MINVFQFARAENVMEKEFRSHYHTRASSVAYNHNGEPDLLLQWGNRKRLRCVKVQRRDDVSNKPATAVRVDRRVVRAEKEPPAIPTRHRILRNNSEAMRSQQQINGATASPEKVSEDNNDKNNNIINTTTTTNNNNNNNSNKKGGSGGAGGGEGSSSASEGAAWPPKFVIALTNKEKEEDFMLFRGSKLPQRPKKRPKVIQRTLNLVCPGSWLCDLTLERYEVREKKLSKKRPRGLKAMGNMESDSE